MLLKNYSGYQERDIACITGEIYDAINAGPGALVRNRTKAKSIGLLIANTDDTLVVLWIEEGRSRWR